jgi:hypothetical protein
MDFLPWARHVAPRDPSPFMVRGRVKPLRELFDGKVKAARASTAAQ